MAAMLKASTNARYKRTNIIIIAVIGLLAIFALCAVVYSLVKGQPLFALAWFIAFILAGTYVIIRVNTIFVTSVSTDGINLYMKNWVNDFLPYDYDSKIKILSEFIPAKTKVTQIPLEEISKVYIGTKNYIKRNLEAPNAFTQGVGKLESSKDYYRKRTVSSMDILYVETYDQECYYMPIVQFDSKDVNKLLQAMKRRNADLMIKSSNRLYRKSATHR